MDPLNKSNTTNQSTGGATPVNPAPPLEPKVFDLASINSVNHGGGGGNFMKKKPLIIGILSVLVLAVAALSIGFVVRQPTSPTPQAEECTDYGFVGGGGGGAHFSGGPNGVGTEAWAEGDLFNNCSTPIDYYVIRAWCLASNVAGKGGCGDNAKAEKRTLQPGQTVHVDRFTQQVGNTGTCGSAQTDLCFNDNAQGAPEICRGATAYLENDCKPEEQDEFSCLYIESVPKGVSTVTPGQTIAVKNSTKGSTGTWQSTWTVTSSSSDIGTIVPDRYNTANWTVPQNPVSGQTWTIKTTVKDNKKGDGKAACEMTLAFGTIITTTPTPTPTPTPTVTPSPTPSTYKTCENQACIIHQGSGNSNCNQDSDCKKTTHKACQNNACVEIQGSGSDSCTSDASCQPAAVPPPIPESGNTTMTLVGIVTGLAALGAALFLAL